MCTVSWRASREGYDLFFNRDEKRTRAAELPPAGFERDGVRFLMPTDGQSGGTWLATNDHGLTVCLLNDYASPWRPASTAARFSRGHLVARAAIVRTIQDVATRIRSAPLGEIAPFRLLAVPAGDEPLLLHWNGTVLVSDRRHILPPVLTSSSFAPAEVAAARLATYLRMVRVPDRPTVSELARFHLQHDPSAADHSVTMSRPDASTRSTIHVAVDCARIVLSYRAPPIAVTLSLEPRTAQRRISAA
jgi:hypothetical protein